MSDAIYQAIQTKWLPFTNHHNPRVKATCAAKSITVEWDSNLVPDENHRRAAAKLAKSLDWTGPNYGELSGGVLKDGSYVWVLVKASKAKSLHIEGRRWFDRVNGNTYHSVRITIDGEHAVTIPYTYGYDDCYLQTALDWLKENGHAPKDAQYGTLYLRETLGGTYSVIDVNRKKDL